MSAIRTQSDFCVPLPEAIRDFAQKYGRLPSLILAGPGVVWNEGDVAGIAVEQSYGLPVGQCRLVLLDEAEAPAG